MKKCHACQAPWNGEPGAQPGRSETCSSCGSDLHCCLNCRLYDPAASNQCRSRTTEVVRDKDQRNFCDELQFNESGGPGRSKDKSPDMQKKWDDLFK